MESRRRNPLRRYPTAVCISVLHFGLTQPKTRALNSPASPDPKYQYSRRRISLEFCVLRSLQKQY